MALKALVKHRRDRGEAGGSSSANSSTPQQRWQSVCQSRASSLASLQGHSCPHAYKASFRWRAGFCKLILSVQSHTGMSARTFLSQERRVQRGPKPASKPEMGARLVSSSQTCPAAATSLETPSSAQSWTPCTPTWKAHLRPAPQFHLLPHDVLP